MIGMVLNLMILMLLATSSNAATAHRKFEDITIGKQFTFHSDILDEDRTIEIAMPYGYEESKESYPVLFFLDGGSNFRYCLSLVEGISPVHLPEMIIIGLPNTDRWRDLHPLDPNQPTPEVGTRNFLKFLKQELIPHIDKQYRTLPYRVLAGHSLSGMFAIYTMVENPELFNAYYATSPSISTPKNLALILDKLRKKPQGALNDKFLYVSGGGSEGPKLESAIRKLDSTLENRTAKNFKHHFNILEGEPHVPIKGIYEALRLNFPDWFPREAYMSANLVTLQKHYKDLLNRFGFPARPPFDILSGMAHVAKRKGHHNDVLEIYLDLQATYPHSVDAHVNLATAYKELGEAVKAKECLKKALQIDPDNARAIQLMGELEKGF